MDAAGINFYWSRQPAAAQKCTGAKPEKEERTPCSLKRHHRPESQKRARLTALHLYALGVQ